MEPEDWRNYHDPKDSADALDVERWVNRYQEPTWLDLDPIDEEGLDDE